METAPFSLTFMRMPSEAPFFRASFSLRRRSSSAFVSSSDIAIFLFVSVILSCCTRRSQTNRKDALEAPRGQKNRTRGSTPLSLPHDVKIFVAYTTSLKPFTYKTGGVSTEVQVRFAPRATRLLRRRELTR